MALFLLTFAALSMKTPVHAEPTATEPLVIAHRGASAVAPENTLASIREAIRLGAKVIEFDVRTTRDGELVVFHDDKLDRLAGRAGTIEESDWSLVKTLDVGAWFTKGDFAGERIPTFEEAVQACLDGGAMPLIEHKTGSASAYAEVIRKLAAADRVIVQSFDWKFLTQFREAMPDVPIGALGSKELDAKKHETLLSLRPDWVGWSYKDLRPDQIGIVREAGAKLALWTVNDPAAAKVWVEQGADGIITDVPDVVAGALGHGS